MLPINSPPITKPIKTHITAKIRPGTVLAVLSPYLHSKNREILRSEA